jgi:hypothetical protein
MRITAPPRVRTAAIQASSVFGITLAILAGLIFAWVFKVVLLTPRKEPPTARADGAGQRGHVQHPG